MARKEFIEMFKHELLTPMSYANGGVLTEASYLEIFAPKASISQYTSIIESEFNKGVVEFSKQFADQQKSDDSKKSQADEDDTEAQREVIYTIVSTSADLNKCYLALKAILTSKDFCKVDGITKLTAPLYDELSLSDVKQIMISYILNFLSTSLGG